MNDCNNRILNKRNINVDTRMECEISILEIKIVQIKIFIRKKVT